MPPNLNVKIQMQMGWNKFIFYETEVVWSNHKG
jgi:hypothetical protein